MARGKSKKRRSSGRRRKFRHHSRGVVSMLTHGVKGIGHGVARVAGPLMIGAGGVLLAAPVVGRMTDAGVAGLKNPWMLRDSMAGAGSDIIYYAAPAAGLIIGGIITEKIVGKAVRG